MDDVLNIKINSPSKIIWEGRAFAFSSKNSQGPFDILPRHANFITLIENDPIEIRAGSRLIKFQFQRCLVYSHDNYVFAYTF